MKLLKVYESEALKILNSVSHEKFQNAIKNHWKVNAAGEVDGRSVCWLYCWAKNSTASIEIAEEAEVAFNRIFNIKFSELDVEVDHGWAREIRYSNIPVFLHSVSALKEWLGQSK